jgi:hypothetical protein
VPSLTDKFGQDFCAGATGPGGDVELGGRRVVSPQLPQQRPRLLRQLSFGLPPFFVGLPCHHLSLPFVFPAFDFGGFFVCFLAVSRGCGGAAIIRRTARSIRSEISVSGKTSRCLSSAIHNLLIGIVTVSNGGTLPVNSPSI